MKHRSDKTRRILLAVNHYLVFFLLVSFVITCCMSLFLSRLSVTMGIAYNAENVSDAAKLTFANVFVLSLIFTLFDASRRRVYVDRPVKTITDAAEKLMQGDFTVQIEPLRGILGEQNFNQIIDCFNKMARELAGTETLRTDFIANVSHELKTPLAVMQNYAVMLQQPDITEEQRIEYAKAISSTSKRLAALITNILKLNKLENQQIFPAAQEYDLGEQLCQAILQFEDAWERKQISIETDLEDGVKIYSDPELLSLVWNNLISNAVKFTPDEGTIAVRMWRENGFVLVSVSDTGCGIRPEVGQHIFEKFYQGDTSHASQGNGLGLALVKRVVDILHGEIRVESIFGHGSTFTVRIHQTSR